MVEKYIYQNFPSNIILCVDMKSFYASIEAAARNLDPYQVPLAVVGDKTRPGSVILAATPALKEKYQIKTANRLYEIPDNSEIEIVESRMGLYVEQATAITKFFTKYVPFIDIQVYSIDESWLNLSGIVGNWEDAIKKSRQIKKELYEQFHLPCSMGLGPNMFLAKVAMDTEGKKKGLAVWKYHDVKNKLWPLPLAKCWGIGSRITSHLNKVGITTIGELAQLPLAYLEKRFGIMGNQLHYHAWGIDLSEVGEFIPDEKKSIGRGITLYEDYCDIKQIEIVVFELAEVVASRARTAQKSGKTVGLGLTYSKSEKEKGFYRQFTSKTSLVLAEEILEVCQKLLNENYQPGLAVRKVRVNLSNLVERSQQQLNLFEDRQKKIKLAKLQDELQRNFDYKALFFGVSLKEGSIKERINTTIGGHH